MLRPVALGELGHLPLRLDLRGLERLDDRIPDNHGMGRELRIGQLAEPGDLAKTGLQFRGLRPGLREALRQVPQLGIRQILRTFELHQSVGLAVRLQLLLG